MGRRDRRCRVRLDINEPAIDLAIGRPAVDGRDRNLEGAIVKDRAIDERRRDRVDIGPQMLLELPADELHASRPSGLSLRQ